MDWRRVFLQRTEMTPMPDSVQPEISVYLCQNCIPEGVRLPRQWRQDEAYVQTKILPCSGKTEAQYLFHALEAGARGVLLVACPEGACKLAQGNYRAAIRIQTVQRLLDEIGMEPERVVLLHCAPGDDLEKLVRDAVQKLCALGESPIRAAC